MKKKITLSNEIYIADFDIEHSGYNCWQVDTFLDNLNIEIAKLERTIADLTKEKITLKNDLETAYKENRDLEKKIAVYKSQLPVASTNSDGLRNIDLINRISNLETMVNEILETIKNK